MAEEEEKQEEDKSQHDEVLCKPYGRGRAKVNAKCTPAVDSGRGTKSKVNISLLLKSSLDCTRNCLE